MHSKPWMIFPLLVIAALASGAMGYGAEMLELTVTTDKDSYMEYEPVIISLQAHNPTGASVHLYWHNSCYYAFGVDNPYLVPGSMCFQVIIEITIAPGETRTWDVEYAGYLAPGPHTAYAQIFSVTGPPAPFVVTEAPLTSGDVFIDFETIPGDVPVPPDETRPLAAYEAWGVRFDTAMMHEWGGNHYGGSYNSTTYPPGFFMKAHLDRDVHSVAVDVSGGTGRTITMTAFDAAGNLIGSVESSAVVARVFAERLKLVSQAPIARLEWWPSTPNSSVAIDNLELKASLHIPGDADNDGDVDLDDFVLLKQGHDFDGDNDSDLDDFVIFKSNFALKTFPDPAP